jgi:hypothetical protein
LGTFLKMAELAQIFGLPYSKLKIMYLFWQKIGWATFWANFSQTHLVTLMSGYLQGERQNADMKMFFLPFSPLIKQFWFTHKL